LVDAWCGEGVGEWEVEVDRVRDDLKHGGDDAGPAACTGYENGASAPIDDDRRCHRGEHSFLGGDGVVLALHESEHVRCAGLGREVVHLIVEQKTRTGHRDGGAEELVERGR
jgi:hypothetical protein